ncbi:MAG: hypothetical protein PWQ64_1699 [Desulfomicrobiaceae bacterium]|jgi:hypothetical protein|nr:hypothetical protein [Desulfomicrobiaceae bacterium]MDK2873935.1 hypothetical protein [Desulfomicrobiaceae bacterium]
MAGLHENQSLQMINETAADMCRDGVALQRGKTPWYHIRINEDLPGARGMVRTSGLLFAKTHGNISNFQGGIPWMRQIPVLCS